MCQAVALLHCDPIETTCLGAVIQDIADSRNMDLTKGADSVDFSFVIDGDAGVVIFSREPYCTHGLEYGEVEC